MRRYSMSEHEALQKVLPRSGGDRRSAFKIVGGTFLAIAFVAGLFFLKQKRQEDMEQNWQSAVANIVDVRAELVTEGNHQGGVGMLYEVQILARYSTGGTQQERWVTVPQMPKSLDVARFEIFRWKGKTCIVRWKSSAPDEVFAEVS